MTSMMSYDGFRRFLIRAHEGKADVLDWYPAHKAEEMLLRLNVGSKDEKVPRLFNWLLFDPINDGVLNSAGVGPDDIVILPNGDVRSVRSTLIIKFADGIYITRMMDGGNDAEWEPLEMKRLSSNEAMTKVAQARSRVDNALVRVVGMYMTD